MSYKIYNTEAIILESRDVGEASKNLVLYTKEAGMIYAHAQGVREIKSKLRFNLQPMTHVTISLVRGKNTWKATSVFGHRMFLNPLETHPHSYQTMTRVVALFKRLVSGEEEDALLFESLRDGLYALKEYHEERRLTENIERLVVMRVLFRLGYLSFPPNEGLISRTDYSKETLTELEEIRSLSVREINKTLESIDV